MPTPEEAHLIEIFEGVITALVEGDLESFVSLNAEWERSNVPTEGGTIIRFRGAPRAYSAVGTCSHCLETWSIEGVVFGETEDLEEFTVSEQDEHMRFACPGALNCECWVELEDGAVPRCQVCKEPTSRCTCSGSPLEGPCANPSVVISFAED